MHRDAAQDVAERAVGNAPFVFRAIGVVRPAEHEFRAGFGGEDVPALRFADRLVFDALRVGIVGMHLHGERFARIDDLREHRKALRADRRVR